MRDPAGYDEAVARAECDRMPLEIDDKLAFHDEDVETGLISWEQSAGGMMEPEDGERQEHVPRWDREVAPRSSSFIARHLDGPQFATVEDECNGAVGAAGEIGEGLPDGIVTPRSIRPFDFLP